jgi:hypothetical protein
MEFACLPCLPQAGAGLNFAHPIVGGDDVELDFERGLRERVKEQIYRQNGKNKKRISIPLNCQLDPTRSSI